MYMKYTNMNDVMFGFFFMVYYLVKKVLDDWHMSFKRGSEERNEQGRSECLWFMCIHHIQPDKMKDWRQQNIE